MADETQPESTPEAAGDAPAAQSDPTAPGTGTAAQVTPDPTQPPAEGGATFTTGGDGGELQRVVTGGPLPTEVVVPKEDGVKPVVVNQYTRRSDNDALLGSWVDVVSGEHAGRRGAYVDDDTHGEDGYPERVIVRTRDAENELIVVNYSDIRPSAYTGGR